MSGESVRAYAASRCRYRRWIKNELRQGGEDEYRGEHVRRGMRGSRMLEKLGGCLRKSNKPGNKSVQEDSRISGWLEGAAAVYMNQIMLI